MEGRAGVTVVDAARGLAADGDPMAATDHLQQLMLSRLTSRLAPIYASATNVESMMPSESYVVPEEDVACRPAELTAVPVPTALDAQRRRERILERSLRPGDPPVRRGFPLLQG